MHTIEAAILVPLLLLVMAMGAKGAIALYQEIATESEEELENPWGVFDFYLYQDLGELTDD